jgi:hypothetical protein
MVLERNMLLPDEGTTLKSPKRLRRRHSAILELLGLGLLLACGGGCGASGSDAAVPNQVLQGKIGGQPWTLAMAETSAVMSNDSTFWVDMYPSTFAACTAFAAPSDVNRLIVNLPRTTGSFDINPARTATFHITPSVNWGAKEGSMQVDQVTATTITGSANFTYDADNTVAGAFQVTICP